MSETLVVGMDEMESMVRTAYEMGYLDGWYHPPEERVMKRRVELSAALWKRLDLATSAPLPSDSTVGGSDSPPARDATVPPLVAPTVGETPPPGDTEASGSGFWEPV